MWDFLDIDWSFGSTPQVAAPPTVVVPTAMPTPTGSNPSSYIQFTPAPAPVAQTAANYNISSGFTPPPAPVAQPQVITPPPAPVAQPAPQPAMGMDALQQTQNLNMVNVPAAATPQPEVQPQPVVQPQPAPVASRPIPQVSMPVLSPQEQALFNRNIPAAGPARMPTQPSMPAPVATTTTASYKPPPAQAYTPPPNALTAAKLFPAPTATVAPKPTTTVAPRPTTTVAPRPTSTVVPTKLPTALAQPTAIARQAIIPNINIGVVPNKTLTPPMTQIRPGVYANPEDAGFFMQSPSAQLALRNQLATAQAARTGTIAKAPVTGQGVSYLGGGPVNSMSAYRY